jgi:CRP-like cAMP-binding protein
MYHDGSSETSFDTPGNDILQAVPHQEYVALRPKLKHVEMSHGEILQQAQSPIRYAYFIESGVVSLQVILNEGREIEVALVGPEGVVGLSLVGGSRTAQCRATVQVPGTALRIEADVLVEAVNHSKKLDQACMRFSQLQAAHTAQLAACNALHQVEQRLARWILMAQTRVGTGQNLPLTHEFLAHMLGTNRATVSLAAESLKTAGLIGYTRRRISVTNPGGLERVACECYGVLQQQLEDYKDMTAVPLAA